MRHAAHSRRQRRLVSDRRGCCDQSASSSGSSRSSRSAFCASLFARAGSSCTSMNTPSTPAATPARRHRLDELRLPGGDAVAAAGQLQAVRHVEDDREAERAQDRERRACRRRGCCSRSVKPRSVTITLPVAGAGHLVDRVAHVVRREELALLEVDDAPGRARPRRSDRSGATGTRGSAARRRPPRPAPPARGSWMSVRIGTPARVAHAASTRSPSASPGPRNEPRDVRFALSYDALKMYGTPARRAMSRSASARSDGVRLALDDARAGDQEQRCAAPDRQPGERESVSRR